MCLKVGYLFLWCLNAVFYLLVCVQNPYVNLRRKIPTLNEGTVKRWIADVGTKQWQNTKRYSPCVSLLHIVL